MIKQIILICTIAALASCGVKRDLKLPEAEKDNATNSQQEQR
jgi:predicted small lipoprotein YifL